MASNEFTWNEIEENWLADSKLALSDDEAVTAFNRVSEFFGREWVESSRIKDGFTVHGTQPTLDIATLGQFLAVLGDAPNAEHLLAKMRKREPDAWAELAAIYLLRSGQSEVELAIEPSVTVGTRNRKPDCAVRRLDGDDWTYVEVTQPNASNAQTEVRAGLQRLASLVTRCSGSFALEVFFKREPSNDEIDAVAARILSHRSQVSTEAVELAADLGTLYWAMGSPGTLVLDTHGQPYTPRLGMAFSHSDGNESWCINVRWPFTDARARAFLDAEAKQLPTDAPGLIMIQTSGAVGAMKAWRSLIENSFQPTIRTRVSAICLFSGAQRSTPEGAIWQPQTKLVINPHGRLALPTWISEQLGHFPSDEVDL
jgi:hypothetical protein